jgi:hypothetical protein
MALPPEARKSHSVWVSRPGHRPVMVRYAAEGDALVCFGDHGLGGAAEGERVTASIHGLHCGPPLVTFSATVHEVAPEQVELGLFAEVFGHRHMGTTWQDARAGRRLLALQA